MNESFPKLRRLEGGALHDKRVFVRVDWNEPLVEGVVEDDFRIKKTAATLRFVLGHASHVVIGTYLEDDSGSVAPYFEKFCAMPGMAAYREKITMLENLRSNPGEKANDPAYAAELAAMADI